MTITYIVIAILITLLVFIKISQKREDEFLENFHIKDEEKFTIENIFKLCSERSLEFALNVFDNLNENNMRNKTYYKSYQSLNYQKKEIILSYYFLIDCINFCEDSQIYQNKDLKNDLSFLYTNMKLSYLNVDASSVPKDTISNVKFGSLHKKDENLSEEQLEELKLIYWRTSRQWKFYANRFGLEDNLGKYCLERSTE